MRQWGMYNFGLQAEMRPLKAGIQVSNFQVAQMVSNYVHTASNCATLFAQRSIDGSALRRASIRFIYSLG